MKQRIEKKITEINNEITKLTEVREGLLSQIKEIENRITQLVGGINTLNELTKDD